MSPTPVALPLEENDSLSVPFRKRWIVGAATPVGGDGVGGQVGRVGGEPGRAQLCRQGLCQGPGALVERRGPLPPTLFPGACVVGEPALLLGQVVACGGPSGGTHRAMTVRGVAAHVWSRGVSVQARDRVYEQEQQLGLFCVVRYPQPHMGGEERTGGKDLPLPETAR